MLLRRRPFAALVAAAVVASFASPAAAAWSTSPFTSTPLCTATGEQTQPVVAPDGSGGAFVAWLDDRGAYSVYATHVTHDGSVAPGWPADGLGVCTIIGYKSNIQLVAGAAGDVFVIWEDDRAGDYNVYAQRLLGDGTVAPGWPTNGFALTNDVRTQNEVRAASDGAGGIYLAWVLEYTPGTDYDVYATRVLPSGSFAPSFGVNGIPINASSYVQNSPEVCADGAGNAIIVYSNEDYTATASIWGQKLTSGGGRVWGSANAGLAVSVYGNDQRLPLVVPDGAGGAIVSDLFNGNQAFYALLDANGTLRDQWLASLPVGPGYGRALAADGAGGAWATWRVGFASPYQGYIEHFDARLRPTTPSQVQVYSDYSLLPPEIVPQLGSSAIGVWSTASGDVQAQGFDTNVAPLWGSSSVMVAGAAGLQTFVRAVSDGADGAIAVWADTRSGNSDICAARVDRFGAIGDAAPAFTRLADVPNDQGGLVSLQWTRSSRDAAPSFPIARYSIWRRAPGGLASLLVSEEALVIAVGEARPEGPSRVVRAETAATGVVFWEYLSQVPARGYAGYSAVAPTTSDSVAGSNPRTSFRIEAEDALGIPYWDSAPDSVYSVDNLAPATPAPFTGTYAGGTSTLAWPANIEPDLSGYRLYRGASGGFVPGPGNLVAALALPGCADHAGAPFCYKLTAVDVHGNESPAAVLLPNGTADVDGTLTPRELWLAAPTPNPAGVAATLRYGLPRAAPVRLAVYDAVGRRVRQLAAGACEAGVHTERWDLRDAASRPVAAGLYFVQLEAEGHALVRRVAVTR